MPKKKLEVKETKITPLALSGGLNITREEFNEVVGKLNEVIEKL